MFIIHDEDEDEVYDLIHEYQNDEVEYDEIERCMIVAATVVVQQQILQLVEAEVEVEIFVDAVLQAEPVEL